ncbi:MAG: DNA polymerase II [Candidatus Woesearchaeota archaeon]
MAKDTSDTGFVIYPAYHIHDNQAYVYIYGRLSCGKSFLSISHFEPYFFIKSSDEKKAKDIASSLSQEITGEASFEKSDYIDFNKKKMTKLTLKIPKDVPVLRKELEKNNIPCYEADIRFPYRFMMDNDILGTFEISGKYEENNGEGISSGLDDRMFYVDRLYLDPDLKASDSDIPEMKILSFDIETDQHADKLYSIACYTKFKSKTETRNFVVSSEKVKDADNFSDEKSLLSEFSSYVKKIDPDIITGWNVIDFDLKILHDKYKKLNIPFSLGRNSDEARLNIQSQFFLDSKANFPGRSVLDGLHLLRLSFVSLSDYKLDTAAKEILGERKLITDVTKKGTIIDDLYEKKKDELVEYNAKDAKLVIDILSAKDIINLVLTKSKLTGMPPDRVQASVATLDSLYMREARKRGLICPSSQYIEKERGILGGYVMNPQTGIHDHVVVLDFKSLYPSIMVTFNIDPWSFSEKGTIVAPNGAKFVNQKGILPDLIEGIWAERDKAKKRKDDVASYALKVIMNSFFGVLANPNCRFFNPDMANAITHFGQYIIKNTANEVEKKGYTVLYSDTDSVFVKTNSDSLEEADKIGKKLAEEINNYYTKLVKKDYERESRLELEYEKVYKKIIFPRVRGSSSDKGAKKRYAGLLAKNGKEDMDFTGLEFVRRDWTEVSKKFQLELLDRIFHEKEVTGYVKRFVEDIREQKYDDLLVYTKAVRKDLDSYTKTTPPHVKAARKLDKLDSNIIKYVITVDGPEPIQDVRHSIDYDHYIEKQIKPIADTVLVFFDTNFDDLMKGTTQKNLFNY